jgi:hypothetical protein
MISASGLDVVYPKASSLLSIGELGIIGVAVGTIAIITGIAILYLRRRGRGNAGALKKGRNPWGERGFAVSLGLIETFDSVWHISFPAFVESQGMDLA